MAIWYRPAYKLTEAEVRYAMKNSTSNRDAAIFLNIGITSWKKYAQMYFDQETGLNLYQVHKNKGGKFSRKRSCLTATLEDIFDGKFPKYNTKKLKQRIIEEAVFEERCNLCNFGERRVSDYTVPLILTWKNGNKRDHSKENLEFVCYNCYHLYYGDMKQGPYLIIKDV